LLLKISFTICLFLSLILTDLLIAGKLAPSTTRGKSDTTRKAGGLINGVGSKPIALTILFGEGKPTPTENKFFHQQVFYAAPSGLKIFGTDYPARCTGRRSGGMSPLQGLFPFQRLEQSLIIYCFEISYWVTGFRI
jgi:hypothetical protein